MKKKLLGGLALALLLAGCGNSGDSDKEKTDDGKKTYKIGIIQQMEHPALDSAREGLEKYLKGKSDAKFEITVKNAQGDNGTADTIAKQFVSEDVDLIYSNVIVCPVIGADIIHLLFKLSSGVINSFLFNSWQMFIPI